VIRGSIANTRYAYRILFGKPERKSPFGEARCGLKDLWCEDVDRVDMDPVAEGYRQVIKPSIFSRDTTSFNDTSEQFSRLTSFPTFYFRILATDSLRHSIIEILYYNSSMNDFQNVSVKFVCKLDYKRTIYNVTTLWRVRVSIFAVKTQRYVLCVL
jgi:hypothetical protein